MEADKVSATPEALDVIERLAAEHGPLVFLRSGGRCDRSSPMSFSSLEGREDLHFVLV